MRLLFTFLIVIFIPVASFAQENIAINDLLNEAKTKLYNQPEQAGKIAEYIISQNESNLVHIQATLLLAKSHYVRGNYNYAVKNAMDAMKLPDTWKDSEMKVETNIFALKLFRNLGLETVADKYLEELISLKEKINDEDLVLRVEGELKQDSALILIQNEKYNDALEILERAQSIFSKTEDSTSQIQIDIALAEALMQDGKLNATETRLTRLQNRILSDFDKIQILDIKGNLYFNQKEYEKAVDIFQQALALSVSLPNKKYENSSLEGLTVSYLALEDTKNFFSYKQQATAVSTQLETDKNLAVNSVYNYINSYQKEQSKDRIQNSYFLIYFFSGLLLIVIIVGTIANYMYASKTKEYAAIYKYISPKKITHSPKPQNEKLKKSSIVPEETEHVLLQKLIKFESGKKYTNPEMSIALLASQFDTNTKYLSEVINREKGKNFNAYINELRINYIIDKLKTDSVYFNYKVSYLAKESGFSSHSSFATVFKSVTGISPTKFMDFLQQRQETV